MKPKTRGMLRVNEPCGLLLIDKPVGPTSHQVVACVKRTLKAEKVGHLGTLDPFASGLLPILVGGATRLADEIHDSKKGYLFTLRLGIETDTLDPSGQIVAQAPVPSGFAQDIHAIIPNFTGAIEQVPPVYSAIKMQGRPLYEHMRGSGFLPADIETKRRTVTIHSLDVLSHRIEGDVSELVLRTVCSKGTYIRSLARDIAKALGTVGHCSGLRRELVWPWHVDDALLLFPREPQDAATLLPRLIPAEQMVHGLPVLSLDNMYKKSLLSGNSFNFALKEAALADSVVLGTLPAMALASVEDVLFLSEISEYSADLLKLQPRKKIR